jgi:hypothetical protein
LNNAADGDCPSSSVCAYCAPDALLTAVSTQRSISTDADFTSIAIECDDANVILDQVGIGKKFVT